LSFTAASTTAQWNSLVLQGAAKGQGRETFSSLEGSRSVLGEDVQQGCRCCLDYLTGAEAGVGRRSAEKEDVKRCVDMAGYFMRH